MFKQHTDTIILIPQHISRNAFVSIQFILLVWYLAYIYEYNRLLYLLSGLYISSMLHWNRVQYRGIVKTVDILFVNGTFAHVSIFDIHRFMREHWSLWYSTVIVCAIVFAGNEYLFYHQVLKYNNKRVVYNGMYWYFSLDYTNPNTIERELAYYRSTITHMIFIHILPTCVCAFCGISAYTQNTGNLNITSI